MTDGAHRIGEELTKRGPREVSSYHRYNRAGAIVVLHRGKARQSDAQTGPGDRFGRIRSARLTGDALEIIFADRGLPKQRNAGL